MKKYLSIISIFILTIVNSFQVYAKTDEENNFFPINRYEEEIVATSVIHENAVEEELVSLEKKYDITANMSEEFLDELSVVADISKEVQRLDESHVQESYNIISKMPIAEKTFVSGNTEEIYSITNYTYIMSKANSTGNTTESSVQSDITIKNTAYYSYYNDGTVKMLKVTSGKTTITRFLESKLRNLVLTAFSQGFSSGGAKTEKETKTIASPKVNTTYKLTSGFSYYYSTSAAKILYGAEVTYSHGSSYTVRAQISLGS